MWARVKSVFLNLWLDQGLTGCHVKWTLATLHRTKKQRFQFIVRLRTLSLLLGNLKARSVSNGKVRESNHITTWNNLEHASWTLWIIDNIKVHVGCSTCLLCIKCTLSRSNQCKQKEAWLHALVRFVHNQFIIKVHMGCSAHFPPALYHCMN